jgi:hypothetical protein
MNYPFLERVVTVSKAGDLYFFSQTVLLLLLLLGYPALQYLHYFTSRVAFRTGLTVFPS